MTPKEKHRTELDGMILKRKKMIVEQAITEFSRKGIESTTMADVARASEVGIASLYRYFNTKTELVIQSALLFWKETDEFCIPSLLTRQYHAMSGIRQIETIAKLLIKGYSTFKDRLIFMNDFEAFLRKQKISRVQLAEYEEELLKMKPYVVKALEKGLEDHTIRLTDSVAQTYMTLSQMVLSYAQKLAVYNDLLKDDGGIDPIKNMECAVHMIVNWLRAEPAQENQAETAQDNSAKAV